MIFLCVTFFQTIDLLVGEGGPVPLELPLEPEPQLGILVSRGVVFGIAIGRVLVHRVGWNKKTF
jgi:hypothetical protein